MFEHWNDAELLDLLGLYDWLYREAAQLGTALDREGRRRLYRLALAAHQRGLAVRS